MELITFKTNINNSSALQRVTPLLNAAIGSSNWQLDIAGVDKQLKVYSPGIVNEMQVLDAIHKAGFLAINIEDFYAIY